jgi:hypothetical protein
MGLPIDACFPVVNTPRRHADIPLGRFPQLASDKAGQRIFTCRSNRTEEEAKISELTEVKDHKQLSLELCVSPLILQGTSKCSSSIPGRY